MNLNSSFQQQNRVCFHTGSDIFYVPRIKFNSFHLIASLFRYFDVWLELAVPSILGGLDVNENMEIIRGYFAWHGKDMFNVYDEIDFYHPSKLITYEASSLGNKFCKYFIQDKFDHLNV